MYLINIVYPKVLIIEQFCPNTPDENILSIIKQNAHEYFQPDIEECYDQYVDGGKGTLFGYDIISNSAKGIDLTEVENEHILDLDKWKKNFESLNKLKCAMLNNEYPYAIIETDSLEGIIYLML